jgi:hypothetical protein
MELFYEPNHDTTIELLLHSLHRAKRNVHSCTFFNSYHHFRSSQLQSAMNVEVCSKEYQAVQLVTLRCTQGKFHSRC